MCVPGEFLPRLLPLCQMEFNLCVFKLLRKGIFRGKALISTVSVLMCCTMYCDLWSMYYDLSNYVVLEVYASEDRPHGAPLQPNRQRKLQPVAYTSCNLSATEQRYSQIEKECVAICNTFAKFDQWLYGKSDIEVHSDHMPLETVLKKPLHKAPARLQRMIMRLQRYSFLPSLQERQLPLLGRHYLVSLSPAKPVCWNIRIWRLLCAIYGR